MITHEQLEFKKRFDQQKCKIHNLSAELVISDSGTYEAMKNVCCDEFKEILTNLVANQIADETINDITSKL